MSACKFAESQVLHTLWKLKRFERHQMLIVWNVYANEKVATTDIRQWEGFFFICFSD